MHTPLHQAALFLLLGEALLAIMGAMIKYLSESLSTEQILLFRNLAGLIFLVPLILKSRGKLLQTKVIHWHIMRGLVGVSAMYCYFWALANMPLTEAFLVKLSSPLFMPLIAVLWLKEKITSTTLIALVIGFIGVTFVLQTGEDPKNSTSISLYVGLIALTGACLAALAKVTIRRMGDTESSQTIVFYFGIIATLFSLPGAILNWQSLNNEIWPAILVLGGVATAGQLALTRAYRMAPTGSVGVYAYSAVIYGAFMGWFFWDEVPIWTTWLGAGLILISGLINVLRSRNKTVQA